MVFEAHAAVVQQAELQQAQHEARHQAKLEQDRQEQARVDEHKRHSCTVQAQARAGLQWQGFATSDPALALRCPVVQQAKVVQQGQAVQQGQVVQQVEAVQQTKVVQQAQAVQQAQPVQQAHALQTAQQAHCLPSTSHRAQKDALAEAQMQLARAEALMEAQRKRVNPNRPSITIVPATPATVAAASPTPMSPSSLPSPKLSPKLKPARDKSQPKARATAQTKSAQGQASTAPTLALDATSPDEGEGACDLSDIDEPGLTDNASTAEAHGTQLSQLPVFEKWMRDAYDVMDADLVDVMDGLDDGEDEEDCHSTVGSLKGCDAMDMELEVSKKVPAQSETVELLQRWCGEPLVRPDQMRELAKVVAQNRALEREA